MQKKIDTAKIVEFFGGKHQIVLDFEKIIGETLTIKAVEKWIERESIPTQKILNLQTIAEQRKLKFKWENYIIGNAVRS